MTDRKNVLPAYIAKLLHPAAHAAAAIACVSLVAPLNSLHIVGALVGGYLPDVVDDKQVLDLQHRTISHSLFALFVLALLMYAAEPVDTLWVGMLAGYASHLIIDLTHGMGIMLWYPISRQMVTIGTMPHHISIVISVLVIAYTRTAATPAPVVVFALQDKTAIPATITPTPTATKTPTPTATPTATLTPTGTPAPDYAIPLAASAYESKRIETANTCKAHGYNNPACVQAQAELQNALYRYCAAAALPLELCAAPTATFTPTRTPTKTAAPRYTPSATQTPQNKSGVNATPLCKTFKWIPCP